MNHKYTEHTSCQKYNCPICDGGLSYCEVCLGAEIELTTECCGRPLTDIERKLIANDELDFVKGKWIEKAV